ncbi:MAG: hypothetical protein P1P74_04060 [Desulfuromonadales bacterium]|nr:hypothetical protein [Desulfuromonadales bacterium]MDT8422531.1 hypothetical protein [Desulfuromonadales bacterium]
MHFVILVEDQSGKKALDILIPKIIGEQHTFEVKPYRGIGRIPSNLRGKSDPSKRILLDQLPRLLRGYGTTFAHYPKDYQAAVFVVCDLDDKCLKQFRSELLTLLNNCTPKPETRFCIAIEEGEAWFLGDIQAIKAAYPKARDAHLNSYANDSICGTWETLADAVYPGGAQALSALGWQMIGAEKSKWAEHITPCMNVDENNSPSFCYFRGKLRQLASMTA